MTPVDKLIKQASLMSSDFLAEIAEDRKRRKRGEDPLLSMSQRLHIFKEIKHLIVVLKRIEVDPGEGSAFNDFRREIEAGVGGGEGVPAAGRGATGPVPANAGPAGKPDSAGQAEGGVSGFGHGVISARSLALGNWDSGGTERDRGDGPFGKRQSNGHDGGL